MLDLTLTLHHYYMQTCYPRIQSPEYTIVVWSLSSYIDLSHYSLLAINVLRFDYYYHIEARAMVQTSVHRVLHHQIQAPPTRRGHLKRTCIA